jgi:hypothetical protein
MTRCGAVAVLGTFLVVLTAASARADTVRDWNLHAVEALSNAPTAPVPGAGQTPPVAELHLAMTQGAVYDALNAIDRGHRPYLAGLPRPSRWASKDAAAATAAHDVLVGLMPALAPVVRARLDALYLASLAAIPPGWQRDGGIAIGAAAAQAMLAERSDDGRFEPYSFPVGTGPGQWRPTPPAHINDPFAWVAFVEPFLLRKASQVRTAGPPSMSSKAYARELAEVRAVGAATGSTRTPEQTALAVFHTDNPTVKWSHTFRTIAAASGLDQVDEARLFAMQNLAAADSLIGCWDDKNHYLFWRPIHAIRLADTDGNAKTTADPNWDSFIASPPYPDHPSGYNCVSAAFLRTAKHFFRTDRFRFTVHSNAAGAVDREYERFSDAIQDVIDARVLQGIHFRASDKQGAQLGREVADWLDDHYLQKVGHR